MYTFESRVRYSETGEAGNLTLAAAVNYLQDCSTFQSEDVGLGLKHLSEIHRAWLLSSWQIIIDRYPAMGEKIFISTWPYGFHGFYGFRNFTIRDEKGIFLVRANSIWFFFDTERNRPAKILESDISGYGSGEEKLSMGDAPRKIQVPKSFLQASAVTVGRRHIDSNHHVNNAQYVDIAGEAVPRGFQTKELRVEYKKAAVLGDVLYPRVSAIDQGYLVTLCRSDGEPCAVVEMKGRKSEDLAND